MLSAIQSLFGALSNAIRPWIVLAPWEAGIRIRLGWHVEVLKPGFNWRIPGVDRINVQTTRLRISSLATQTLMTTDVKTLVIAGNVAYSIADIRRLYDSVHHAEDTIRSMASEALAEVVNGSAGFVSPAAIAKSATELVAPRLEQFGLTDIQICLTDFAFVRAYRMISDQRWGNYGDQLNVAGAPSA